MLYDLLRAGVFENRGASFSPDSLTNITMRIERRDGQTFKDTGGTQPAVTGDSLARVNDSIGGANVTQATGANQPTAAVSGAYKTMQFDGTNDTLAAAGAAPNRPLGNASCTIACWVKVDAFVPSAIATNWNTSYLLWVNGSGHFEFQGVYGGVAGAVDSGITPTLGRWYLIVGIYDKAAGQRYCEVWDGTTGTRTIQNSAVASDLDLGSSTFTLGEFAGATSPLTGHIFGVWKGNAAWTLAERTQLYNYGPSTVKL